MEDLQMIRLFLAVAEEMSFSGGARREGISAAVATRRIAALEQTLNTRLFSRSTRSVNLTAEGDLYRTHAIEILEAVNQSHEALRGYQETPRGRLRVTSRTSIGLRIVVPFICEFRRLYPEVTLGLELSDTPLDMVAEGFDVAIAMGQLADSSLVAKTLAVTDSLVCASPDYLAAHGVPTDPRDLKHHACLSFQARSGRNTWKFSKGQQFIDIDIQANVAINNGEALKELALDGIGIVLATDWLVTEELANGKLIQLFSDFAIEPQGTPISALYPSRRHLPQKVRVFLDFIAEKAQMTLATPPS